MGASVASFSHQRHALLHRSGKKFRARRPVILSEAAEYLGGTHPQPLPCREGSYLRVILRMAAPDTPQQNLDAFVAPFIGQAAWGAAQGHGSFLNLEFGPPELIVKEWHSAKDGVQRQAYVRGQWRVWIYCCQWQFSAHGKKIAWSESSREAIARATGMLDGQNLLRVSVDPPTGKSLFAFDLGGLLETWPVGSDPKVEQWFIFDAKDVFAYRADGRWRRQPTNTPGEKERWRAD